VQAHVALQVVFAGSAVVRSLPDARDIVAELTAHQVTLSLGESLHDPTDPVGRLLFTVLAMVAEFESHLIKIRTREGMKAAATPSTLPEGFRTPAIMDAPHSRASTGPATTDPRAHAATSRPPGSYEKNAHIRGQHAVVAIAALQSGATFGDAPQQA